MSAERGSGPDQDPEVYDLSPDEWKDLSDEVSEKPEAEVAPEEPKALITPENADTVVEAKREREKITVNYVEEAHKKSREEIAARYKINEGNVLSRFIKQTKAVFAGEYSDLTISQRVAEAKPEDQQKELNKAFRLFGRDGALRLGKVGVKTGVAGGIGAGIAAILGGTIGSPIFLAALAGGAATRGAFELYRHFKKDEREGRTKVIESRSKVYAEAAKLQDQATALINERDEADEKRLVEIDKELAEIHKYFIDLTHYESYQALYAENKSEKQLSGLAETQKLGHEKMRLEKKREKVADLIAAGGSVLGGLAWPTIQENLFGVDIEKVKGIWADFDKDGIRHFVERISPSDISSADPGFMQQLDKSGGFVFNYNDGSAIAEHGIKKAAQVTTAVLNNGNEVHVIQGLNDSIFKTYIQNNPELVERASALAGSFWKEAAPVAAGHLLMAAEYFSSLKKGKKEEPNGPDAKSTDGGDGEPPVLPGGEEGSLPQRKKKEDSTDNQSGGTDDKVNPAIKPAETKPISNGEAGTNLPVRWAEKDDTGQKEILEEIEEDIEKQFRKAYSGKEDEPVPVNPDKNIAESIITDVEKIYDFGAKELDQDLLSKFGVTISKAKSEEGNQITSIAVKDKEENDEYSVQTIKLEYPQPDYDNEGKPIPGLPRIIISRSEPKAEGGVETKINPSYREVTALLNIIADRFEDAVSKKELEKDEPVPITINGEKTVATPTAAVEKTEAKKTEENIEPVADINDISDGDYLYLKVPEGEDSRVVGYINSSGERLKDGTIKFRIDRVDKKNQVFTVRLGKTLKPFGYSTIESMVIGKESKKAE